MNGHGLPSRDGAINKPCDSPPNRIKQEAKAMMMESKRTAFELWLREYGSHLEQLAKAESVSGPEQQSRGVAASARDLNDPADGQ
jgi:hypothetical protein